MTMQRTRRARCASGPSSPASYSNQSPPPPPPDRFGFILEACGWISPSQNALLRSSPFIRQEEREKAAALPADIPGLTGRIIYQVFGFYPPQLSSPRPRYSDAAAAELALVDYFLRLGPGRLHLLRQRQPHEGKQAGRTPFPSAPQEAAKEMPEWGSPPAEAPPSSRLDAAAVIPTPSSEAGKEEKAAALKRGRPDSSDPSRVPSSTADELSSRSKKPCAPPNVANHTDGTCSLDVGVIPNGHTCATAGRQPLSDHGGRGSRKLPPSILYSANWGVGDEGGGARVRHGEPLPRVEQEAGGKPPATAAAAAVHAPSVSSPVGRSLHAENARTVSSADAAEVEEQGLDKGEVGEPRSPSMTALVEESRPSRVGSDAISLSSFIDVLLRFWKNPSQTPEDVDLSEVPATKDIQLPRPKWWRPGGYGRPLSPGHE